MSEKRKQPDRDTQIEIYRRMALLKANDDRFRKLVATGAPYSPVPFSKPLEAQFAPDRMCIAAALRTMTNS